MTVNERIEDIQKRTGLSESIIRSVLRAETDSAIDSLKRGEVATLIGRCSLVPSRKSMLEIGGKIGYRIRVSAKPSTKIEKTLSNISNFDIDSDEDEEANVLLSQITELA